MQRMAALTGRTAETQKSDRSPVWANRNKLNFLLKLNAAGRHLGKRTLSRLLLRKSSISGLGRT